MDTALPYHLPMLLTVVETALFAKLWPDYWTEEECVEFTGWLANHADAGDVIPGSGGCRKVRWSRAGMGKRGGVRVIYYAQSARQRLCLLLIYAKSVRDKGPRKNNSVAPRASLGRARKARCAGKGYSLGKQCNAAGVVRGRPNAGTYSCADPNIPAGVLRKIREELDDA